MTRRSPLVLVFDRDASTRAWYRAAFVSTDYRVSEAADGPEAVALLASQLPDLIVTELRAHHRDGLTLCVIKRSTVAVADIPVLMVLAGEDPDTAFAARLVGASAVLEKPASSTAVLAIAQRLILATPPAHVARRWLHRTLANLRERFSDQTEPTFAIEEQARHLLTREASTASSIMLANDAAKWMAVSAAACDLTGYSEAELLARSVWDLARPDMRDYARVLWDRFLARGECEGEFQMVEKDGTEITIQLCARANVAPGLHAIVAGREPVESP
jgi:PAS domain S-box-containing protein